MALLHESIPPGRATTPVPDVRAIRIAESTGPGCGNQTAESFEVRRGSQTAHADESEAGSAIEEGGKPAIDLNLSQDARHVGHDLIVDAEIAVG